MSSPATRSSPVSGLSIPAIRLSSVLLPEPEGPMSARKSPSAISMLMSDSTGTTWSPRRYDFARPRISTRGAGISGFRRPDAVAVAKMPARTQHDAVARGQARAPDLHEIAELTTGRDRHLGELA